MANILFVGPEQSDSARIAVILALHGHRVYYTPERIEILDLTGVDLIFADGEPWHYIRALLHVRELSPSLPFVVITRSADTPAWLDAIEAGATDCCSASATPDGVHAVTEAALCGASSRPAHLLPASIVQRDAGKIALTFPTLSLN